MLNPRGDCAMIPDSVFEEITIEILEITHRTYEPLMTLKLITYLKSKLTPMFEFNSSLSDVWNNEEDEVCWAVKKEDL